MDIPTNDDCDRAGKPVARSAQDTALLLGAARGERWAQEALLEEHIGRVRRIVGRFVGNSADVDDLVQMACTEILRSMARFRGDASVDVWVGRVTTRVIYKYYRSNRRRNARLTLVAEPEESGRNTDERSRIEDRDSLRRAHELVHALKPEWRIVFLLVAVEGHTLAEAAELLELSLAATKSRFWRARQDLDRRLQKDPGLVEALRNARGGQA